MQVVNSLRSAKQRHPDCQLVKRKGRLYVICKSNPRFKGAVINSKTSAEKNKLTTTNTLLQTSQLGESL